MLVEIGTCDFDTQAGHRAGLFVEPLKYYFDRLPATCVKENVAVSNYTGTTPMFYIPPEQIAAHGLPDWLRGCNSLGRMHPTVQHMLDGGGLPADIICQQEVPVVRLADLLAKHQITEITELKIDTEGHDAIIVHDLLDTSPLRPRQICFENNGLVPAQDVLTLVRRLQQVGYLCHCVPGLCTALYQPDC